MVEKIPMTAEGLEPLKEELHQLKTVERYAVIKQIAEAREHGDLSENAEYHAAKEQQSFIEGRIQELDAVLGRAQVIDPAMLSGDTIKFGATVKIVDEDTDEEEVWQIVGDYEANTEEGRLSISAPVARALVGKAVGDSVKVKTPKGVRSYEILEVSFKS